MIFTTEDMLLMIGICVQGCEIYMMEGSVFVAVEQRRLHETALEMLEYNDIVRSVKRDYLLTAEQRIRTDHKTHPNRFVHRVTRMTRSS